MLQAAGHSAPGRQGLGRSSKRLLVTVADDDDVDGADVVDDDLSAIDDFKDKGGDEDKLDYIGPKSADDGSLQRRLRAHIEGQPEDVHERSRCG